MPSNNMNAKNHVLRLDDITSILTPANPREDAFTASKIVFTMGPACCDVDTLATILEAGASVARIDLTWGTLDFHMRSLANLQAAMRKTRKLCGVMVDTLGREIFIRRRWEQDAQGWPTHNETFSVKSGEEVVFTVDPTATARSHYFPVNYPKLTSMVKEGDQLYIGRYLVSGADDASLYVQVTSVSELEVKTQALNSAELNGLLTVFHVERSEEGLDNPQNEQPLLSEHDVKCIREIGQKYEIDFLNLSYTRTGQDVREARKFLYDIGLADCKVIAKVETRQALFDLRDIMCQADAIIMSRGNLGLDCLPQKMARIQKNMISCCNMLGVPILLTRIVDTMVTNPRCTRAEATDVANAVLDGADGFVLGAETLRGQHPVEVVRTVLKICKEAEKVFEHGGHFEHLMKEALKVEMRGLPAIHHGADSGASSPRGSLNGSSSSLHDKPFRIGAVEQEAAGNGSDSSPSMSKSNSFVKLGDVLSAMTHFAGGLSGSTSMMLPDSASLHSHQYTGTPILSKLESIASSSVRAADKAGAAMIVVFTDSGHTAQMVAKYRPPVPIVALVIPHLYSDGLSWKLSGGSVARGLLITRGVLPMLAAPDPNGEKVLQDALMQCQDLGLVGSTDNVVCLEKEKNDYGLKMLTMSQLQLALTRLASDPGAMKTVSHALASTASSRLNVEAVTAALEAVNAGAASQPWELP